jgi:predicted TIM-barrel fold metal-dependent hydrolase
LTEPARPLPDIPIVDAHQHFWDLTRNYYPWLCDEPPIPFRYGDYSAIRRNYLPDDLRRDSAGLNLRMTVHMEAEWDRATAPAETHWLESVNAATGLPTACVGHAEFERADIRDVLAAHATSKLMRGIRQKPAAAPSPADAKRGAPGSMDDPVWRDGYALLEKHGLSYDLQTPWWHLDAAADLAADFPRTTIVINHTGLPSDRSPEAIAAWRAALECVARQSNVAIKISGLGRRGPSRQTGRSSATPLRSSAPIAACSPATIPWTAWPVPIATSSPASSPRSRTGPRRISSSCFTTTPSGFTGWRDGPAAGRPKAAL